MESKIGKYLMKLYKNEDDQKKHDTYLNKIKYYLKKNKASGQHGGSLSSLDTHISSVINDIVNNNYKIITDLNLIKNISYNLDNCKNEFFSNMSERDIIEYKPGYRFNCFMTKFSDPDEVDAKNEAYLFKKNFSLNFTDVYMQKNLSVDKLKIATNCIYFILNHTLNTLVENLIRIKRFGDKTEYLLNNILLLYKGGNTTRMLFNCFIKSAKGLIGNKSSVAIDNSIKNLNDMIQNYNIGDWDYLIKIDYDKLKNNHGFNDNELVEVKDYTLQSFNYAAVIIKNKLQTLLKSKINIENGAKAIQSLIYSQDTLDKINQFITLHNNYANITNGKQIENMNVNKVYSFDKIIDEKSIYDMKGNDYNMLHKNSFIFRNTGTIIEYNGDKHTMGNYFETDEFFVDENIKSYLPEFLKKDIVYISYLSNLSFCRRYAISSFNLMRVKVNNLIEFDVKFKDNDAKLQKNLFVNMELVDISISNNYDSKGIFNYQYYYDNCIGYIDYNIIDESFSENKIIVSVPSPHMMFVDICSMLFIENQFIWEDLKYSKRIGRMFFLSLPCMYTDGLETNQIMNIYKLTKELFESVSNLPDIQSKLEMMRGHYDIITNPKNDKINEKINYQCTEKFKDLHITHKLINIAKTSKYTSCRYLEFLIENYIRMLIMSNYIIYNISTVSDQELIRYELQIHRILELPNVYDYLKPRISSTLTPSLSAIYMSVRGTNHSLKNKELVPFGPLPELPLINPNVTNEFVNKLKTYEHTLIDKCEYTLVILNGLLEANVNNIITTYEGESLF